MQGLDSEVGYVLPISWDYNELKWHSAPWQFRNDRLQLIPGDSPMGLRLPLDSLPWQAEDEREVQTERDTMEDLAELDDYYGEVVDRYENPVEDDNEANKGILESYFGWLKRKSRKQEQPTADMKLEKNSGTEITNKKKSKKQNNEKQKKNTERFIVDVPHTALSIEARDGYLHVFMPPLSYLEHYLELISAIELTAEKTKTPVRIEGYPPPRDHRITSFQITPDPGVIEVNIHPTTSWKDLVNNTEILYEEARSVATGYRKVYARWQTHRYRWW